MELNNLKIEVLKFEDGEEFSVLNDDLIEYVEEPEFIEYEYIETDDHEIKEDEIALQRWEAKHIAIKLDLDSQCHNSREENFRCSNRQCKREIVVFASQEELDVHNILHVRQIDNNTCPICNKVLANAGKLNNHMETRHVPKNYYCDNCGKVFKSKDNLRLHMSHHRIHFLVECKACKKTYKSMQSLRYHLRQHFEHHQCETCGQVFEHKKLLLGHVAAKHNQDLMLPCRYCTRMFSRNDVREAHERDIHKNGEVGSHFKCTECSAAFDLREDLMRHKITSHYSGPVHTCIQCGKIFKKKSLLSLHMNSHREKSIQCDACLMMFTFVTGLAKHKKMRRCRGLASKSFHDNVTKEEIARIAKKQLIEITVNPIVKQEVNIFSDFNDENEVEPVESKKEKKKPGRKPKSCITITTLPTRGPKIVQSSSIYKSKAAVTIRTLTQREIDQQRAKAAAEANIITTMSSSGRIIRRRLPMQIAKVSNKLTNNIKKRNVLYQCDKCGIKMDTKFKLLVHFRSHRRNRTHHCPCCEKFFGNLVALKKHCAILHAETNPFKEKRFQCDLCPKRYLTEFLLGQHQLSHENLKSQQCPQCPFATNAPYDLKNHIKRAHFPSKDFDCPEDGCDKSFKRRCDMENHRKSVHTKIKVYVKCPICEVIVLEKGLQSHTINRHSEKAMKKPFVCTICGKAERYEKNLQRHYESVHEPQDRGITYGCPDCAMAFFRRRELTAHSFEHFTGTIHSCPECDNKYKSKKELTNHLYSHRCKEYPCNICKIVFQTKSGRSKHMRKHGRFAFTTEETSETNEDFPESTVYIE